MATPGAADPPDEPIEEAPRIGVPPQQRLPRAIWRIDVDIDDIADLTAPDVLAGEGITRLDPTRRQWPKTQPIGASFWHDGARGVLAPGAVGQQQ